MSDAKGTVQNEDSARGFLFALSAYLLWGVLPLYLKLMDHIPAFEVVTHRILWSLPIAGAVLIFFGRTSELRKTLSSPRMLAQALLTASLITINWGVYVWAISVERTVDAALGYYINPLLSVGLGAVLLGERLNKLQLAAIGLAVLAVSILTWQTGTLPWVALALAGSWGFYALFRKTLPIGPSQGFFLEILILSVPALGYAIYLHSTGAGHFVTSGTKDTLLLIGCGCVTAIPLILYANGAKLLRLSTIGMMQYIAPTFVFLIAVLVFKEPFPPIKALAFGLIWAALALFTFSVLKPKRAKTAEG